MQRHRRRRLKDAMRAENPERQDELIRQHSCPICFPAKGRCAMARHDVGYLPRGNPCAQCGKPIASPDWIENGPRRISYLWHCQACDYQFEAMAFYDASKSDLDAIAA
jgi:transcription elongation factor Elf1